MGNGKKAKGLNGVPQREVSDVSPPQESDLIKQTVIVIAYDSPDGEIEDNFANFVNDVKAMSTFKNNVRIYAVIEDAAKNVLAQVEKSGESSDG